MQFQMLYCTSYIARVDCLLGRPVKIIPDSIPTEDVRFKEVKILLEFVIQGQHNSV